MAVQNLSLQQAVHRREGLMQQVNSNIKRLNTNFSSNPEKIPVDTLYQLVGDLRETNAQIERQKQTNLEKKKCCNCMSRRGIQVTTVIVLGINFLAWCAVGGWSIYKVASDESSSDRGKNIAEVAITVAALFFTAVVAGIIKDIDGDLDRFETLARISRLEQQGEDHFQQFLIAFKEFKESEDKKKEKLAQCVHTLDNLPTDGLRNQIPSRDHWISLMIAMLPDEHPIKMKFLELKAAALKIFDLEEQDGELIYAATTADTSPPKRASLVYEKDSLDSSEESSGKKVHRSAREKFKGEKLSLPSWFQSPKKKEKHQPHSKSSGEGMILLEPVEHPAALNKRIFRQEWSELEANLGFAVGCIQLGDSCFDRACNVYHRIEDHPYYRQALVRSTGSLKEIVIEPENIV